MGANVHHYNVIKFQQEQNNQGINKLPHVIAARRHQQQMIVTPALLVTSHLSPLTFFRASLASENTFHYFY